jgi:hypothetical protein
VTAEEVLGACGVGSIVIALASFLYGVQVGHREEANRRADPASYPPGSCSQQVAACEKRGGNMDFHQFRLHDETDEPTCKRWVEEKLR